jgi:hypothetical protein
MENRVTPEMIGAMGGSITGWLTSVTFGGADLRTVYIDNLKAAGIPYFRSPIAGLRMVHW